MTDCANSCVWKPVPGYNDFFEASDDGQVRRADDKTLIHQTLGKNGYFVIQTRQLYAGKNTRIYVHRLICAAFYPNTDNKSCVDHINTIATDNRACNLRWATPRENANNPLSKQHLSAALKRYLQDPVARERLKVCALEQSLDPVCIAKRRASAKIRWSDDNERKKQSARTTLYFTNPTNRDKARQLKQSTMKACQCIETGVIYECLMDAQRATGIAAVNISRTCRAYAKGKILHAGGYTWRYPTQTTAS